MRSSAIPSVWEQFAWLLTAVLVCGGCGEQETIRRYQVAKPQPTRRLLGAIVPRGEQYWFFKVTGSRDALESQAEHFLSLIKSLRFPDDLKAPPAWTLPAGWSQTEGSGFRYATIEIKSRRETLQLSVTKLPRSGGDDAAYVLSNVNLWRQQLDLVPFDASQLAASATQLSLPASDKVTATVVDFLGSAARGGGHGGMAAGATPQPPAASEPPLRYTLPDGWSAGQRVISRGGVEVRRQAAFEVRQGENAWKSR